LFGLPKVVWQLQKPSTPLLRRHHVAE